MDIYSMVADQLRERSRQQPMNAREEDLYYARLGSPHLPRGLVASMVTLAGVMLVLLVGGYAP